VKLLLDVESLMIVILSIKCMMLNQGMLSCHWQLGSVTLAAALVL